MDGALVAKRLLGVALPVIAILRLALRRTLAADTVASLMAWLKAGKSLHGGEGQDGDCEEGREAHLRR